MKKKILAILLVGMFMLTGITSLSVVGMNTKLSGDKKLLEIDKDEETTPVGYIGSITIFVDNDRCEVVPDLEINDGDFLPAGEYDFDIRVYYGWLDGYYSVENGLWSATVKLNEGTYYHNSSTFAYDWNEPPDDIIICDPVTIPKGKFMIKIEGFIWFKLFYNGNWVHDCQDSDFAVATARFSMVKERYYEFSVNVPTHN